MTIDRDFVSTRYDLDPRIGAGTLLQLTDVDTQSYNTIPLYQLGYHHSTPDVYQVMGDQIADVENTIFVVWHEDSGVEPRVNDRIIDSNGITWNIVTVDGKLFNTRYYCFCARLTWV